jgi:LexA-binding, inner membrane-associated putative hydrolase
MYGGHIGIALAGKGYRSAVPLWLLVIATQLPDWADGLVCTIGGGSPPSEMLSHSIPAIAVLATVLALLYYAVARDIGGSALAGAIVVSHMVADYVTGLKPTWPGAPYIGLQLYREPALDFVVETIVIVIGWIIYRRSLPTDRRSSSPVYVMLFALLLLQLAASVSFSLFPGIKKC